MSNNQEVIQLKTKIADQYIQGFSQELSGLNLSAVSLVEKKMKDVIIGNDSIEQSDLFDADWCLSHDINQDIILRMQNFVKEKRTELAQKNTLEELNVLMREIVSGTVVQQKGTGRNAIGSGILSGTLGAVGIVGVKKAIDRSADAQKVKRLTENVEGVKTKNLMKELSADFALKADPTTGAKFTPKMRKLFQKSADEFLKAADGMDDGVMSAMKAWGKLGGKLPNDILKTMNVPKTLSKALQGLDDATLKQIATLGNESDIQALLLKKGIKNIPADVLTFLAKADTLGDVKGMVEVFTHIDGLKTVAKGIAGIGVIDMLFLGFDVWFFVENLNEADLIAKVNESRSQNKKSQAYTQLAIGLSSFVAEIAIIAAAGTCIGGPFGLVIGLAVGAVSAVASMGVDALYFDVKNFYLQNKDDYLRQQRSELKQAILQSSYGIKEGDSASLNEWVASVSYDTKVKTLKDAWESLITNDELESNSRAYPLFLGYKNSGKKKEEYERGLSDTDKVQFHAQYDAMQKLIDIRMDYINTSYNQSHLLSALKSAQGMQSITNILAESQAYKKLKDENKRDDKLSFSENKTQYMNTLQIKFSDIPKEYFLKLNDLYTNPSKFWELYQGALFYKSYALGIDQTDPEYAQYQTIVNNIAFFEEYYASVSLGVPLEENISVGKFSFDQFDYNYLHAFLLDFDSNKPVTTFNSLAVKGLFVNDCGLSNKDIGLEVSDSTFQNIIYRIAKETNGYPGKNTMLDLMAYFSDSKAHTNGLYYNKGRYINNDWSIDKCIDPVLFDDPNKGVDVLMQEFISASNWNYVLNGGFSGSASALDTATEGVDSSLNIEFWSKVKNIVAGEKAYQLPSKKKNIEESLVDYIQQHAKEVSKEYTEDASGGLVGSKEKEISYVELPFYLISDAKKAGIGNLEKYLFSYQNGKIVACTSKAYLDEKIVFSHVKIDVQKQYIEPSIENFSADVDSYLNYVEQSKNKFIQLISLDENELDISPEYRKIFRQKVVDRDAFVSSLLFFSPAVAQKKLKTEAVKYHDYFENTSLAIMSVVSGFSASNDLDEAAYLQQIISVSASLTEDPASPFSVKEYLDKITSPLNEYQKKMFTTFLNNQTLDGQTINSLLTTPDADMQSKVKRALLQIVKSIYEASVLKFDSHGGISDIASFGTSNFTSLGFSKSNSSIEELVKARLQVNLDEKTYFIPSSSMVLASVDLTKIQIQNADIKDAQSFDDLAEIQKIIAQTTSDLIWFERGKIAYDPIKKSLNSWAKSLSLDVKTLKISGISLCFKDTKELLYVANLLNRFKAKYPGVKNFYFGSRFGLDYGIYREESGIDTQILDLDIIKKFMPSLLDSNNDVKSEFINYLNA